MKYNKKLVRLAHHIYDKLSKFRKTIFDRESRKLKKDLEQFSGTTPFGNLEMRLYSQDIAAIQSGQIKGQASQLSEQKRIIQKQAEQLEEKTKENCKLELKLKSSQSEIAQLKNRIKLEPRIDVLKTAKQVMLRFPTEVAFLDFRGGPISVNNAMLARLIKLGYTQDELRNLTYESIVLNPATLRRAVKHYDCRDPSVKLKFGKHKDWVVGCDVLPIYQTSGLFGKKPGYEDILGTWIIPHTKTYGGLISLMRFQTNRALKPEKRAETIGVQPEIA